MSTDLQLAANRRNAQLSTGPKTESGKHRTRLNAYRHGLTGQIQLFTPEDHAAFELHCKGIVEALAPVGALEADIAQSVAEDRWRLKRIRAIETTIFAKGQAGGYGQSDPPERDTHGDLLCAQAICQAEAWLEKGNGIALLGTYQNRIQRSLDRNMAELRTLRAEREAAKKQAQAEAKPIAKPAAKPALIPQTGSDFSTREIHHKPSPNEAPNPPRINPVAA